MSSRQALTILFFGAIAGWYLPDLLGGGGAPFDAAGDAAEADVHVVAPARADAGARQDWIAGETRLQREQDGHFYANVRVNGGEFRFLVDTGASIVALTGEDAQAMGLEWDDAKLRTIGRGASGDVRGVPVMLDNVEVNGIEARGVQAAIIPDGLDTSLLGQSFLGQVSNVEISGDAMTLGD